MQSQRKLRKRIAKSCGISLLTLSVFANPIAASLFTTNGLAQVHAALITGEQFTINIKKVYAGETSVIETKTLTTTCKDTTGHSGYNHSINLEEFHPSVFGWSETGWKGWYKNQYGSPEKKSNIV
ncbi:hypothetical protein [Ileibacterium valens]|uniref:hypothetical protein n=1 Tax=Ileibacterium valens TaxID=1862668 RepID=UPI00272DB3FC|nr:hypothetical protein [Ileibacterium valens]